MFYMVAQQDAPRTMTVDAWRELERGSHDAKHEYIDGQVYAMAGGSRAHARIASDALRAIEDALAAAHRPCNVYNSDVAARLSPRRYTYPDVTVTCDERDEATTGETEVQAPRVIIEVISDSTEAYDRGEKFGYYRACPTIQEYVLIATKYQAVEVYRRTGRGWTTYQAYGSGDEILLESIDVNVPLALLYKRTDVPERQLDPEGEV